MVSGEQFELPDGFVEEERSGAEERMGTFVRRCLAGIQGESVAAGVAQACSHDPRDIGCVGSRPGCLSLDPYPALPVVSCSGGSGDGEFVEDQRGIGIANPGWEWGGPPPSVRTWGWVAYAKQIQVPGLAIESGELNGELRDSAGIEIEQQHGRPRTDRAIGAAESSQGAVH